MNPTLRMKAYILVWLLITATSIFSQTPFSKIQDDYQDGEDFFQDQDYREALYYFLQVEQRDYLNANLKFKIGICYLHLSGEETKAIPYLLDASKHISMKYKSKGIEEKSAPLHSLFYLGNAYRINNEPDKALEVYKKFSNHKGYDGNYNDDMVNNEIDACKRAKEIKDAPVDLTIKNLGEVINSPGSEINPVVSGDGKVMVYLTALKFYNALYYTTFSNGSWTKPENINPQVLSDGDFYPAALSFDGKELYLVKWNRRNSDIYVSYFENGRWSTAKPLNKNVNSSSDETGACISSDGITIYFVSNRGGGRGGYDIYRSRKNESNEWGKAENLGKIINTKGDESTPSISSDGKTLYFSSQGHYNMGGFDIFYSTQLKDGAWSRPMNIGYPLNTTSDNKGYVITSDGKGFLSRIAPDGFGKEDIYEIVIRSKFVQQENKE